MRTPRQLLIAASIVTGSAAFAAEPSITIFPPLATEDGVLQNVVALDPPIIRISETTVGAFDRLALYHSELDAIPEVHSVGGSGFAATMWNPGVEGEGFFKLTKPVSLATVFTGDTTNLTGGAADIATGDFNGDGQEDVIAIQQTPAGPQATIVIGAASAFFEGTAYTVPLPLSPFRVIAGELNGDPGDGDEVAILFAEAAVLVYRVDDAGSSVALSEEFSAPFLGNPIDIEHGLENGAPFIAVLAHANRTVVGGQSDAYTLDVHRWSPAFGEWSSSSRELFTGDLAGDVASAKLMGVYDMAVGDIDNDGLDDIAMATYGPQLYYSAEGQFLGATNTLVAQTFLNSASGFFGLQRDHGVVLAPSAAGSLFSGGRLPPPTISKATWTWMVL